MIKKLHLKTFVLALCFPAFFSCQTKDTSKSGAGLSQSTIKASLNLAVEQYKRMDKTLQPDQLPRSTNPDGSLRTNKSDWWTSGFYPGSLWYLYEFSKDPAVKELALTRTKAIEQEQFNDYDHDIGFKMFCSQGNALRLTGDQRYIPILINSANTLVKRFDPKVQAIRSWGSYKEKKNPYLVIIDNMMNLELLFWATEQTKDSSYYKVAIAHADKTLENHFRPDGSSFHVIEYDANTGAVTRKRTEQGYADPSAWARGQAWALYGYTMTYRETGLPRYLAHAQKIADFLLKHPNLPADKVPYWDFNAPNIPNALRDASAGSIIASALLELSTHVKGNSAKFYRENGEMILNSLSQAPYRAELGLNNNFLLQHSVGHLPQKSEVDVPLSYADYYYIEGLMRFSQLEKTGKLKF